MHKIAAELRNRELTQEIYDIGDEVATYTEHLIEAVRDWDRELAADCLAEFDEILDDARRDSRAAIGELLGLRQALTSGVRSGMLSAAPSAETQLPEPTLLTAAALERIHPISGPPIQVSDLVQALQSRTETVAIHLEDVVDWVLAQTDAVAHNVDAVSLPHLFARVGAHVNAAVGGWMYTVADAHPAYTRTMRGHNPPTFLEERARIDAVVAKVAAKRAASASGAVS